MAKKMQPSSQNAPRAKAPSGSAVDVVIVTTKRWLE